MSAEPEHAAGEADADVSTQSENVGSVSLESIQGESSLPSSRRFAFPAALAAALVLVVGFLLKNQLVPLSVLPGVSPGSPDGPSSEYDEWGLPLLAHFEETLTPTLKHGKDAISEAAVEAYTDEFAFPVVPLQLQGIVAAALSSGQADSLLGLTVNLEDVKRLTPSEEGKPVPRNLYISNVVGFDSGGILVEAQEDETQRIFTMRIRMVYAQTAAKFPDNASFVQAVRSLDQFDEEVAIHVCQGVQHLQQFSSQGIAVPEYTANISGAQEATLVSDYYVFGRVQLLERLQGNLMSLDLQSQVISRSKEYIASRLLLIVLKLQRAGVGITNLDWNTMQVRFDGSFVVETFHSSGPFGSALGVFAVLIPHRVEPQLALSYAKSQHSDHPVTFQPDSALWILGTLLYELFTNGELPYGSDECTDMEQAKQLAEQLLANQTRSDSLLSRLEGADVPPRWRSLILRLLEPDSAHRITSLGIVKEFPDLTRQISTESRE
ncbi:hypothetical protein, conserved [Eimeria acervulina]|uniref:Protein kinase domain-containing protein n=1 Tax=Eimeria acervulina TaxID=5801 RepID=U6GHA0_EIMAC|nr:hypothetical protein, conserved [Eimeria acervulina]CDI79525.1 hypothetical protein, conserved [Eimeria acervulina]